MQIPVCHLSKFGNICGCIYYDTAIERFKDSANTVNRALPVQDVLSCVVESNNICTVVGRNIRNNTFSVCFGDNFIYELTRNVLLTYRLSNMKLSSDGKLLCIDGKLPDLSYLFEDRNLVFVSEYRNSQQTSNGVARKFRARYQGRDCIVKFQKSSELELNFEVLYKQVCDLFGIPCCYVKKLRYNNKPCVISRFEYSLNRDVFRSFRQTGTVESIYNQFSVRDKNVFNAYTIIDFLTSQQDRHLSNLAVVNGSLYPLYDNGECLGLGSIGIFSSQFRRYAKTLGVDWCKRVLRWGSRREAFLSMIPHDRLGLVRANIQELGL